MGWLDRLRRGAPETGTRLRFEPPRADAAAASSAAAAFAPGQRVGNAYEIRRLLGEGAMGIAYLVRHLLWDEDVVLKVPRAELAASEVHDVTREAEAWTGLGLHPHVAYCHYVHRVDGLILLVIEYVDGGDLPTLADWIASGRAREWRAGLDLAIQMCHGLEHAHARGLVHRDVKPPNVLVTRDGVAKLTDFGIAKRIELAAVGAAGHSVDPVAAARTVAGIGTYEYMAPEQFETPSAVDSRADVFALGVCFYEMFCGRRPYEPYAIGARREPPDPDRLRGERLPDALNDLLRRCVAWDRADRPGTVAEVRRTLCAAYGELFAEPSARAELPALSWEAGSLNNRAMSLLALGNGPEAERAWAAALEADPHHADATYNFGLRRWRAGSLSDAAFLRQLEDLVAFKTADWVPRWMLAQVHLERDERVEAERALTAVRGKDADRREVRHLRAAIRQRDAALTAQSLTLEGWRGEMLCLSGDLRVALSLELLDTPTRVMNLQTGRVEWSGSTKVWDMATGRCLRVVPHDVAGTLSCPNADGTVALASGPQGELRLWDVSAGRLVRAWRAHEGAVGAKQLSDDGRVAMSVGRDDGTFNLWDVDSGALIRTLDRSTAPMHAMCLSRDGALALTGAEDRTVKVWHVATGRCLHVLDVHEGWPTLLCVSRDGRRALSGCHVDGQFVLRAWSLQDGRLIRTFAPLVTGHGVVVSGSGDLAALIGSQSIKILETATGRILRHLKGIDLRAVSLTENGDLIVVAKSHTVVQISKVKREALLYEAPLRVSRGASSDIAARGAARLAAATRALEAGDIDAAIREVRQLRSSPGYERHPRAMSLWAGLCGRSKRVALTSVWKYRTFDTGAAITAIDCHDGTVLCGDRAGSLACWNATTGACDRPAGRHMSEVNAIRFDASGTVALSGSRDRSLKLWNVSTGACVRTFDGHSGGVTCVDVTEDGSIAISGSRDRTVRIWDAASGRCLQTLDAHAPRVDAVAIAGGGSVALSGGADGVLRVWHVATGECLHALDGHSSGVRAVAVDRAAHVAVTGGGDATVRIWSAATGACLQTLSGHGGAVAAVAVSGDGRLVLSGCVDGTLKVWDARTGHCLHTLHAGKDAVRSVAFSPESHAAWSASASGVITFWTLDWELEA